MTMCIQMQRSGSQPACAAHGPPEMSLHFVPSEAGMSGAFKEPDFLYRPHSRGVR